MEVECIMEGYTTNLQNDNNNTGNVVNCKGKIYHPKSNLFLTTKMEGGKMYVVLDESSKATTWQFVSIQPIAQPAYMFNFAIRDASNLLYMTPISIDDKIYIILQQFRNDITYLYKIYRSGYGPSDMQNFVFTDLANLWNVTADGKQGDKIELTPNRGDDSSQKFQFRFIYESITPGDNMI